MVVPAGPTLAVTVEIGGTAGLLVAEVSLVVAADHLAVGAARMALTGLEADAPTMTTDAALVVHAEGVRMTLEAEVAPTTRMEEEIPLMRVATAVDEAVMAAPS